MLFSLFSKSKNNLFYTIIVFHFRVRISILASFCFLLVLSTKLLICALYLPLRNGRLLVFKKTWKHRLCEFALPLPSILRSWVLFVLIVYLLIFLEGKKILKRINRPRTIRSDVSYLFFPFHSTRFNIRTAQTPFRGVVTTILDVW